MSITDACFTGGDFSCPAGHLAGGLLVSEGFRIRHQMTGGGVIIPTSRSQDPDDMSSPADRMIAMGLTAEDFNMSGSQITVCTPPLAVSSLDRPTGAGDGAG